MASAIAPRRGASTVNPSVVPLIRVFSAPYVVTAALAVTAGLAAGFTLFGQGILRGLPVMNGSARGTALVSLFVAVPLLVGSAMLVGRGAVRPLITWLGAAAYLAYNGFMFLFMSPFNSLFLAYAAMFGFAVWVMATVLHAMDVPEFGKHFAASLPARPNRGDSRRHRRAQPPCLDRPDRAGDVHLDSAAVSPGHWPDDARRLGAGPRFLDPAPAAIMTPIFLVVAAIRLVPLYFYFRNLARS